MVGDDQVVESSDLCLSGGTNVEGFDLEFAVNRLLKDCGNHIQVPRRKSGSDGKSSRLLVVVVLFHFFCF